jgi:dipeptidyl aminopeptidase/acylaminoacyl peptidase
MKIRDHVVRLGIIACLLCAPASLFAQGTRADYERARNLRAQTDGLVYDSPDRATWIEKSHRFWYRKSVKGGYQFMSVDADALSKQPLFDHEKLAASLSSASGQKHTAVMLPFNTFTFVDNLQAIEFTIDSSGGRGGRGGRGGAPDAAPAPAPPRWRCTLTSYQCTRLEPESATGSGQGRGVGQGRGGAPGVTQAADQRQVRVSPDRKTEAFIQNYNIFTRPVGSRQGAQLSWDGSEGEYYTINSAAWSPDSLKLAAFRIKPGYKREVHYIQSSPEDQLQPKHSTIIYNKPGDLIDVNMPALFHVDTRKQINVDNRLFANPYENRQISWWSDSRAFTFEFNQRGHQVYRVIEVDAATGKPRALINEEAQTFFCYSGKRYRADIGEGKEMIWMSERDGWNHLYLYDGTTGTVKNQITKGQWVVLGVDKVDEAARQIWFRAGGMNAGKDPYFVHCYRINFDGTGLVALTQGDGTHSISFPPSGRGGGGGGRGGPGGPGASSSFSADLAFYVDSYSRVDLPPVLELHRTSDQKMLLEIERADMQDLIKSGWVGPEVFVAKGRDGKTDIWGIIFRPRNLIPAKKYPVIENIYAGPQGFFVPKAFSAFNAMQSLAELGFIVVQIDGMGTNSRSKAFHDVAWKNLGDAGFPDRILWHKAVAAKYPYYDISRVGTYGTSAGGQNSMGALLFHPEFYKVAVSNSGCHDNRMDKIWWNEQWMGYPIGPEYGASSNVDNAYRLQGKLYLIVPEMDTNVDPSSTLQVVNRLIRAGKYFDLLFVPGGGHGAGGEYGERKRNDFFVRHLLGVEPPDWNRIEATQK